MDVMSLQEPSTINGCVPIGAPRNLTIEERLLDKKSYLESQLKDVNAALDALKANPEMLKVLCLISKIGY